MDTRHVSDEYTEIATELIRTEPALEYISKSDVTIVYLGSEHEKRQNGKLVYGQCEKIPEKYKWAIPCDFTITIFEPNTERLSPKQLKVLILHELLHVGIEADGNEEHYYVVPHDVEEFKLIIEKYGVDWSTQ